MPWSKCFTESWKKTKNIFTSRHKDKNDCQNNFYWVNGKVLLFCFVFSFSIYPKLILWTFPWGQQVPVYMLTPQIRPFFVYVHHILSFWLLTQTFLSMHEQNCSNYLDHPLQLSIIWRCLSFRDNTLETAIKRQKLWWPSTRMKEAEEREFCGNTE